MTNTPLSSADQSKVMIFVLLLLPSIFFLIGLIPAIFLLFGVFMMKKSSDFSHIETAARNARGYLKILIAVGALVSLFKAEIYYSECLSPEGEACYTFFGEEL